MSRWMGIDGGGSTLRVVVVDDDLTVLTSVERAETANPSVIGHEAAAGLIREAMREALTQHTIDGVGLGIAGAANAHSEAWLREVVAGVLPDVFVAPSSDMEIALVGAAGERRGVLLLSGTGSVAYGINEAGRALQVGGWGYLLGDEGSGYWIGMQALRTLIHETDGLLQTSSTLPQRLCAELGWSRPHEILRWLYASGAPRTRDVAALAHLVFEAAAEGDTHAHHIIETAAQDLHQLAQTIISRLEMHQPFIAFGGGLLTSDTLLSHRVCALLTLPSHPIPRYSPVIGAALLAKLTQEKQS